MPPVATTPRRRTRRKPTLKFSQKLLLNQWMLGLFEVETLEQLVGELKDENLEKYDENNVSLFHHALTARLFQRGELSNEVLLGYDENIFRHTQRLNAHRTPTIRWKYFQYVSLLFTEIYLDRYFRDSDALLESLNVQVTKFNEDKEARDQVAHYEKKDLAKLAFWMATGGGKTLLMHVNILQYRHYLAKHGRTKELNRTILLTPNEGLSKQHLAEFELSGIQAELFNKDGLSLFTGQSVEIIDIHKLGEESGEKVVAVESFEGNNLVLVDEGHRGAGAETWKARRDQLCEDGFTFEYSATFGQAVAAANNADLTNEYAKCVLFDFSYKYFYRDGYGKDYRILNLAEDHGDEARLKYLTACLLAFVQQLRIYDEKKSELAPFLLERPLWVFVGGSVTKEASAKDISDVLDILLFLASFANDSRKAEFVNRINLLITGTHGLMNVSGQVLFDKTFTYFVEQRLTADQIYQDILQRLFNSTTTGLLHVEHLKGSAGEVALRLGESDPFGVINVGDPTKLCKQCERHTEYLVVSAKDFNESLFHSLNDPGSKLQVLIGSKKFSEGWSSWRVSTMGLMNVGKTEGAQIIQLFGRGVRLKGYNFGLKRSTHVEGVTKPKHLREVETLNVFGIQASYMEEFKKFLEEEGLPTDEERIEFILPTFSNLGTVKLKVVQLPEGLDFKKDAPKPTLDKPSPKIPGRRVLLDWYPKIQSRISQGVTGAGEAVARNQGSLRKEHLAFFDWDSIYWEMQDFKNDRAWFNLNLDRGNLEKLLSEDSWYTLLIPPDELVPTRFDRVRLWQEIAVALLKKYADAFYKAKKAEWEAPKLEYRDLDPNDPNMVKEYRFLIEKSETEIQMRMNEIKEAVEKKLLKDFDFGKLQTFCFGQHLYQPLVYLNSDVIQVTPVELNEGERNFVLDLRKFHEREKTGFFADKELYLLRNRSKGRGIGFFEAGNFYPDFILWLVFGGKQYVSFVDPKGLRNLEGGIANPKIEFYNTIKKIEKPHLDPNIVLNSFIVTPTRYSDPGWWTGGLTKAEFEARHVFFQKEDADTYVGKVLARITASATP
jgi:hypothetical protein